MGGETSGRLPRTNALSFLRRNPGESVFASPNCSLVATNALAAPNCVAMTILRKDLRDATVSIEARHQSVLEGLLHEAIGSWVAATQPTRV